MLRKLNLKAVISPIYDQDYNCHAESVSELTY
jgi:hypothetical protein